MNQEPIMTLFRKFLKPYLRTLAVVLVINLAGNFTDFQSGKADWRISFLYSAIAVTAGFLLFVPLNRYYLNRLMDWKMRPEKSFLVFILFSACIGAIFEFGFQKIRFGVSGGPATSGKDFALDILFTAILFVVVALTTTFRGFIERWRESIEERARIEQLLLKSQFESLKNQVNPHFLFNALNTLTSVIRENEEEAVNFVQQLSRILRYSLERQEESTVSLQDELKIARSYLQIFKQRYHDKLNFDISIPPDILQRQVICHGLIMLLENAIKHNEISGQNPLTIHIYQTGDYLAVENNLQPRKMPEPSGNIGLANIRDRYKRVTTLPVLTEVTDEKWLVQIPII
jgi:two-component system LytT family sensor kinase